MDIFQTTKRSFPSWERGLKQSGTIQEINIEQSFPSWERGLKRFLDHLLAVSWDVVPLVGTWIETHHSQHTSSLRTRSFPSWERGLKLQQEHTPQPARPSFPSWERGLKQLFSGQVSIFCSRSPRGNVD